MHKVLIWGVWTPGVVQGGQGSRAGLFSRSRSFSATACGGSPSAIYNRGVSWRGREKAGSPRGQSGSSGYQPGEAVAGI